MGRMILILALMLVALPVAAQEPARPADWAEPMELDGVPNLHRVSDRLYRSAQPSAEGMKNLREMGVETVVNLRSFSSDRDEIGDTGLGYEHIYMKAWHPERKEVVRFLTIVTSPRRTPVLVHCRHGADRTGTMVALYRIAVEGWSKEKALQEMTQGGYGFHKVWNNLPRWIRNLDIESIQQEVGIEPGPPRSAPVSSAEDLVGTRKIDLRPTP
ncbi:MAG: tyrosine-protein phosphatase [Acidobacteriota bacterium]